MKNFGGIVTTFTRLKNVNTFSLNYFAVKKHINTSLESESIATVSQENIQDVFLDSTKTMNINLTSK